MHDIYDDLRWHFVTRKTPKNSTMSKPSQLRIFGKFCVYGLLFLVVIVMDFVLDVLRGEAGKRRKW